jgi:hypothetical protein
MSNTNENEIVGDEIEDEGRIDDPDQYLCADPEKNGWCTCASSFDACDCAPEAMTGSPTICVDCKTVLRHTHACETCSTFPCKCR